jgi:superfamily II DNA or RNA helicase
VIADLDAGGPLPEGILPLLSDDEPPRSDQAEVDDPDGNGWGLEETYFPLPYNEEQIRVLEELEKSPGVLVHGPPGTGKSHTIANLVCHLLATGKRVLVTSHTPRALRVLKKKIPDELTSLCVILLGDDQDAMQSLEQSVEGITQRQELNRPGFDGGSNL